MAGISWDSKLATVAGKHASKIEKAFGYRTVGDASCTGAVASPARTAEEVVDEVAATRLTERGATRADDRASEAAMEDRKKEGYF